MTCDDVITVFRGDKYNEKADVYSFGMVLYELLSGVEPHRGHEAMKFANMVCFDGFRPSLPEITEVIFPPFSTFEIQNVTRIGVGRIDRSMLGRVTRATTFFPRIITGIFCGRSDFSIFF